MLFQRLLSNIHYTFIYFFTAAPVNVTVGLYVIQIRAIDETEMVNLDWFLKQKFFKLMSVCQYAII